MVEGACAEGIEDLRPTQTSPQKSVYALRIRESPDTVNGELILLQQFPQVGGNRSRSIRRINGDTQEHRPGVIWQQRDGSEGIGEVGWGARGGCNRGTPQGGFTCFKVEPNEGEVVQQSG